MKMIKNLICVIIIILPWKLKRIVLMRCFGYEIDPGARIGIAWIFPKKLIMKRGSKIGHLNVAIHLDLIKIGEDSVITRSNWITGYPTSQKKYFSHKQDRRSELIVGEHSAITKQHHIDCTDAVVIGNFVTMAGYGSQILTHSINLEEGRQDCNPVLVGDYCFIGTNCVLLGGSVLPANSVLGAKSLLNKSHERAGWLYGGVPSKEIKAIPENAKYFSRKIGAVS